MGHINVTDDWLYEKMPLVDENIIRELEQQTDDEYQFSLRFEKKMEKIIRKRKKSNDYVLYLRTAAAVACMFLVIGTTAIGVYAYGIRLFETAKTIWKDRFIYSYSTEKDPEEMEVKKPKYVPDGYVLSSEQMNNFSANYVYRDHNGKELVFLQMLIFDKAQLAIDSEYDWIDQIELAGSLIDVRRYKNGYANCYLEYGNCVFVLTAVDLDDKEIKQIYEQWILNK